MARVQGAAYDRSVRLATLAVLVVAACYAPQVPSGVACDDTQACPIGQHCIAGFCQGSDPLAPDARAGGAGGDGSVTGPDGNGALDSDGDGVPDAVDNCPAIANADQGNEDGDALGDACDPCPELAGDATDSDGDGVGDACDPHPQAAGDKLVLFEGFHHGVPQGWQLVGGATQLGDDLELDAGSNVAALAPPATAPADGVLLARIVVESTHGTQDSGTGVAFGFDVNKGPQVGCELYAPQAAMTTNHGTSLYDYVLGKQLQGGNLAWQAGTAYTVAFTRKGIGYTCSAAADGAAPVTTTATTGSATSTRLALEEFGITARIAWLMVIASP